MAGKSPRDKCFGEAIDAWNDAKPKDKIEVNNQTPWVLKDGKWHPQGKLERFWDWVRGKEPYRVPDWTATINGTPVAGDNKFEGDSYSNRKGRSGKTQLQDQNDMNKDHSPGNSDYQDLNLNPEKCKCGKGEPKKETISVPVAAADPIFGTVPGKAPSGAQGSVRAPSPQIRMPPIVRPFPVPAFPFG